MRAPEKYLKGFDYIKDEDRRIFAGALSALDHSVGEVILALSSKGMLENSLVVFASDNGADTVGFLNNGGSNWPLRGQKITAWEGGVRVPAVLWSPKVQNPGRIWDGLMHVSDWFPTLCTFAGGDSNTLADIDGYDLWSPISKNSSSSRNEILLISDPIWKMSALRVGDLKLVRGSYPEQDLDGWYGDSGRKEMRHRVEESESFVSKVLDAVTASDGKVPVPSVTLNCGNKPTDPSQECNAKSEPCVFNIKEDPCEYRNLAKSDKQLLERLISRLKEHEEMDVIPLNKKRDFLANPIYYNCSWVSWQDSV